MGGNATGGECGLPPPTLRAVAAHRIPHMAMAQFARKELRLRHIEA